MPETTIRWQQIEDFQERGPGDLVKIETPWGQVFAGLYEGSAPGTDGQDVAYIREGNKGHAVRMGDYKYFFGEEQTAAPVVEDTTPAIDFGGDCTGFQPADAETDVAPLPLITADDPSIMWEELVNWEDIQDAPFVRVDLFGHIYSGTWRMGELNEITGAPIEITYDGGKLAIPFAQVDGISWYRGVLPEPTAEPTPSINLYLDNRNLVWAKSNIHTDTPWRRVGRNHRYSEAEVAQYAPFRELVVKPGDE